MIVVLMIAVVIKTQKYDIFVRTTIMVAVLIKRTAILFPVL